LAYANDVVLIAKNREAMQDMMSVLKEFLRELDLNVNKSKIFVFIRKSKDKKEKWLWNNKVIEEVQVFKHLGFVLSNKGNYIEHRISEERKNGSKKSMRSG